MQTIEQRVIAHARGWLGTRFHHQGRLKAEQGHRGGVDCLGLLVGVACELDLRGQDGMPLAALDHTQYGHYPDSAALSTALAQALQPVMLESLRPADVVLMCIDGSPQHLGIVTELDSSLGLIHAYAPARQVVEHALDAWWRERIVAAFRLPT